MFNRFRILFVSLLLSVSLSSCGGPAARPSAEEESVPEFLEIKKNADSLWRVVSISPFDGSRDTLSVDHPFRNLVVMSTSYIGFLNAIGCDSVVTGVSGAGYVCDSSVQARIADGSVADVGYDASPDYEKIVSLKPDLVLAYEVSSSRSQFFAKLKSLGIRVFFVHEHLERHPLARAAYVRLFGALTMNMPAADSVLAQVSSRYYVLRDSVSGGTRKVLMNIPYNGQWYIPGQENYVSKLVRDAGGVILGSEPGRTVSSSISIEKAYSLSKDADCWLDAGWCGNLSQLLSVNPLFEDFLSGIKSNASRRGYDPESVVWNDTRRLNSKGGNDFWESGPVHPDLVLQDLIRIFHPDSCRATGSLHYYLPLH